MDDPFARARILYEQRRYDLAEREILARLETASKDPYGFVLLSLCRSMRGDPAGMDAALRALELAPEYAGAHHSLGWAHINRNELKKAEVEFRRAIELQPWYSGFFGSLSNALIRQYRWKAALNAADLGLTIDPNDQVCLNCRGVALTNLGRNAEARAVLGIGLANNPEERFLHANSGWSLLHGNDPVQARFHFREALRLDPRCEWAREGLLESLRANNWLYRRVLQLSLWRSRFHPLAQLGMIIALYLLVFLPISVKSEFPDTEPLCVMFAVAYMAFVLVLLFAKDIVNVVILTGKEGRMLLTHRQKWSAVFWLVFCISVVIKIIDILIWPGE